VSYSLDLREKVVKRAEKTNNRLETSREFEIGYETVRKWMRAYREENRLTPNICAKDYEKNPHAQTIAKAAKNLNELRENWLNPPDLIRKEPEIVEGYPERMLAIDENAAHILKKRTLTNLYNEKPNWLKNAHQKIDEAVANAYGWKTDLNDEEILSHLLALNIARNT